MILKPKLSVFRVLAGVSCAAALLLGGAALPSQSIGAEAHSCDKLADVLCNLCGSGSTTCTDAREVATECKANSRSCLKTACDPTLGALDRVPENQRKQACEE